FERFYRGDRSRNRGRGGAGLGLTIVQGIVEAHLGEVLISSTVGAGTTATIRLPAIKEAGQGK
ncbi:ATP-binding protein, partial [Bacillus sp. SIMBA_069]